MAQFPVKIPANIGLSTPVPATGTVTNTGSIVNTGVYNPLFTVNFSQTGTPATVTDINIFTVPTVCTLVGMAVSLNTVSTGTITVTPKKQGIAAGALTALCTTNPAIVSTATAPCTTMQVTLNGVLSSVTPTVATGVTAPVLKTDGTCQFVPGDSLTVAVSGTFTNAVGLAVTFYFRDDSGSI